MEILGIFGLQFGQDHTAYENPIYPTLLNNAIRWAVAWKIAQVDFLFGVDMQRRISTEIHWDTYSPISYDSNSDILSSANLPLLVEIENFHDGCIGQTFGSFQVCYSLSVHY